MQISSSVCYQVTHVFYKQELKKKGSIKIMYRQLLSTGGMKKERSFHPVH